MKRHYLLLNWNHWISLWQCGKLDNPRYPFTEIQLSPAQITNVFVFCFFFECTQTWIWSYWNCFRPSNKLKPKQAPCYGSKWAKSRAAWDRNAAWAQPLEDCLRPLGPWVVPPDSVGKTQKSFSEERPQVFQEHVILILLNFSAK